MGEVCFCLPIQEEHTPPPNYPEDVGEGVDLSEGFNHDLATIICIVRDR